MKTVSDLKRSKFTAMALAAATMSNGSFGAGAALEELMMRGPMMMRYSGIGNPYRKEDPDAVSIPALVVGFAYDADLSKIPDDTAGMATAVSQMLKYITERYQRKSEPSVFDMPPDFLPMKGKGIDLEMLQKAVENLLFSSKPDIQRAIQRICGNAPVTVGFQGYAAQVMIKTPWGEEVVVSLRPEFVGHSISGESILEFIKGTLRANSPYCFQQVRTSEIAADIGKIFGWEKVKAQTNGLNMMQLDTPIGAITATKDSSSNGVQVSCRKVNMREIAKLVENLPIRAMDYMVDNGVLTKKNGFFGNLVRVYQDRGTDSNRIVQFENSYTPNFFLEFKPVVEVKVSKPKEAPAAPKTPRKAPVVKLSLGGSRRRVAKDVLTRMK